MQVRQRMTADSNDVLNTAGYRRRRKIFSKIKSFTRVIRTGTAMAVTAFGSGIRLATMSVAASPGLWRGWGAGGLQCPVVGGFYGVGGARRQIRATTVSLWRSGASGFVIFSSGCNHPP